MSQAIYLCMRVFFGKGNFLENNLYESDAASHQKEDLTRTEASLFCEIGINCWAQKFPT